MIVPGSVNPLLLASAAAAGGLQVSRSLRFNSADSAYLNRTPASAGNRKTWTWAGWVKRSKLGTYQYLLSAYGGDSYRASILFNDTDTLTFAIGNTSAAITTAAVYRDVSAWYHLVFVLDTTQATQANGMKIYINGVQQTVTASGTYTQNDEGWVNTANQHLFGYPGNYYLDGYLANIQFIDGQALTPASFAETDATTGQWIPKAYSGSYGTNGFYLQFADNSSNTASTLGKDYSGLGNNWTPNNFSVTAGAGNDSLVDSPTNYGTDTGVGGEVRGNYCTWNPLDTSSGTLTNGNLDLATGTASYGGTRGTISVTSGKWYWEVTPTAMTTSGKLVAIGICASTVALPSYAGAGSLNYTYMNDGQKRVPGSDTNYGATFTVNDVIGVALDLDAGTLVFYKNGSSQGTAFSSLSGSFAAYASDADAAQSCTVVANFGQRAFAYTAPSGFKALCTQNLPEGTITTSGTYTGNGVADGPFVYLNGVPTAMTVGGNAVTFGTHADKLSNGFKIRTTSTTYNQNASTYSYSITTTGDAFKYARAQSN